MLLRVIFLKNILQFFYNLILDRKYLCFDILRGTNVWLVVRRIAFRFNKFGLKTIQNKFIYVNVFMLMLLQAINIRLMNHVPHPLCDHDR